MDGLITLAVLIALAIPVMALVALITAVGARSRVQALELRLHVLEARLARGGATAASPAAAPAPSPPEAAHVLPATLAAEPPAAAAPPTAAEPPPTAEPPSPPIPPPAPAPRPSFEERFGTQWAVWAGGLALVLGGYFLVQYSIEQGWFGPGMRIFCGALLAAALLAAGEWARRKENLSSLVPLPTAHIPSILTAAGTAVAYATVYAAYALTDSSGRPSPSCCSGSWRCSRSRRRCCMGRRLPGWGSSARMSRRSSSQRTSPITGRSTSMSPS